MESRGIRNNNPFNIRYSSFNSWRGKIYRNKQDKEFEEFEDVVFGVRAGIVLLRNYIFKKRLTSVAKIVEKFAPASENDVKAYITFLYGCDIFCPSDVTLYPLDFFRLCKAICRYESNYELSEDVFIKAIDYLNPHKSDVL